ncbi:unnamed protein product [Vitrella brassicaformis CCMP3155]|uniref:ABC transporter domain-containing protein n=1 Tax=Vitrella brassicaformis (strain CCMP3155) TaxID=1169540 RepID=A0A0G4ECK9_VITBC|nr:unnamed protein product [Vitrella brassicaformis CCMP3155]|eukprot:CEL93709.1 unnamed protein product [Vitrella brassicaformis CCMP3155]
MSVLTEQAIKDILCDLTSSKLDEGTLEYAAGMVKEEGCTDPEELQELIGPFLLDGGAASTDAEVLSLCKALHEKLTTKPDAATTSSGSSPVAVNGDAASTDAEDDRSTSNAPAPNGAGAAVGGGGAGKLKTPVVLGSVLGDKKGGYQDPYLGLKKGSVNFNTGEHIDESVQKQKALQRERERQAKLMKQWEKSKQPPPPPTCRHGDKQLAKMTDINVESFSVIIAGRELLRDAPLKLAMGRKYGLVGRNGIGKSTFLNALARGEIHGINPDMHILHIEQEIRGGEETALEAVLAVDVERADLLQEEKLLLGREQTEELGRRLAWIYQRLNDIDAQSAESRASTILDGLGFTTDMQHKKTREFSGGWRMRVALARALFGDPDLLLLDEPTNHLDLHAVAWLTQYLSEWPKTCIIVSHARQFLNDVCTDIIHFSDQTLTYYRGNYDTFEEVRAGKQLQQQREFEAQEAKRAHMQKFVDKFRYNAKRASLVQSRLKAIAKLPMLEAVASDPTLVFSFDEPEALPTPILQLQDCYFKYGEGKSDWLLKDVAMTIDLDSRIAVCGVNGSGKSTLLKLMIGTIDPSEGHVVRHSKLRIGFFSQHHVDQLDLTLTAVQSLQTAFPDANLKDEDARTYLGKFGISGLLALEPLYVLSGGQKSRVAIALVAFKKPHVLIMDEPTNHLDLDAVQALIAALNNFQGGVVIVSHDAHMLSCVADEVWHVDHRTRSVAKFGEDFESYRKQLLKNKL